MKPASRRANARVSVPRTVANKASATALRNIVRNAPSIEPRDRGELAALGRDIERAIRHRRLSSSR